MDCWAIEYVAFRSYFAAAFIVTGVKIPAVLQERASSEEPIQLEFNPQGQIWLFNRLLFCEWRYDNSDLFLCSLWQTCQACAAFLDWTRDGGFIAGGRIELLEFVCSWECVFVLHQQFLTEHQEVNVLFCSHFMELWADCLTVALKESIFIGKMM